jgi:hypothetical protein
MTDKPKSPVCDNCGKSVFKVVDTTSCLAATKDIHLEVVPATSKGTRIITCEGCNKPFTENVIVFSSYIK